MPSPNTVIQRQSFSFNGFVGQCDTPASNDDSLYVQLGSKAFFPAVDAPSASVVTFHAENAPVDADTNVSLRLTAGPFYGAGYTGEVEVEWDRLLCL